MDSPLSLKSLGKPLPSKTPLWRYIKLHSLLSLLQGAVFIPTIATLQSTDPMEAKNVCKRTREKLCGLSADDQDWLLARATWFEKAQLQNTGTPREQRNRLLVDIWLREIAKRRCAWCWFNEDIESMALWNIYGREGVAISTTPERIAAAMAPDDLGWARVARVEYNDDPETADMPEHCSLRPYLFKKRCYSHEKEVRVIIPADYFIESEPGLTIFLNYRTLVQEVRLSPFMQDLDALFVKKLLEKIMPESGIKVTISESHGSRSPLGMEMSLSFRTPVHPGIKVPQFMQADL